MVAWARLASLMRLLDRPEAVDGGGQLSQDVVAGVAALVPSDSIACFDFHRASSTTTKYTEWLSSTGLFDGPPDADLDAAFWTTFWASPFCTAVERPDQRDVVVMQHDVHPGRSWRRTPMYVDILGKAPVEAEAIVPLASAPGHGRRLLLTRQVRRDYSDDDRLVLQLLRPHLNRAVGRAARADLTDRQLQVLRLAAVGETYGAIGHSLHMSPQTARKHLENAYSRLGVRGRAEAVARAFPEGVPT
jgi:DNA-binding CsgD family transcriptional regulator